MMPLANRPMMEHIVGLLRQPRLRRDRGHRGLPGQPHPHLLRRRLRVRRAHGLRHRGDAARHRRLGAQRHGRARRAVPRHLRRRAHRHRPDGRRRASTTRRRRAGHDRPRRRSRTRSSSASSSPARTASIERFLEKPTWGQVFSDTINTGIYVLEPEIFDFIPDGRAGRLLRARCSRRCSTPGKPLYGAVAEGYWEDVGTLEAYLPGPQGRARRQGRASTSPASELGDGVWLGEGAEVDPDAHASTGRAVIGDYCRVEAGAHHRRLHRARRATCGSAPTPYLERAVVHDNAYIGRGGAPAGRGRRAARRPAPRRPLRRGRGARRRVLRRRATRCVEPGREGLPVQDGRGRAPSSTPRSSGSRTGRAQPVRPRRRRRAGQRRHHPRAGRAGGHGLRHHAQEGRHGHHVAATRAGRRAC